MSSQAGESNSGAAVRGLLLVLVAVVVGVLLLRSVDDPDDTTATDTDTTPAAEPGDALPPPTEAPTAATGVSDAGGTGSATVTTVAPTVTAEPSTDTTSAGAEPFQPRPASEVSVQVANSTAVRGAAGRLTDRFKTLSYITNTPTNYAGTPLDSTIIYYKPGALLEARAIAGVLELDPDDDVRQMPADTSAIQDFESPDVLVALGTDIAE